jgi:hypothetical protein
VATVVLVLDDEPTVSNGHISIKIKKNKKNFTYKFITTLIFLTHTTYLLHSFSLYFIKHNKFYKKFLHPTTKKMYPNRPPFGAPYYPNLNRPQNPQNPEQNVPFAFNPAMMDPALMAYGAILQGQPLPFGFNHATTGFPTGSQEPNFVPETQAEQMPPPTEPSPPQRQKRASRARGDRKHVKSDKPDKGKKTPISWTSKEVRDLALSWIEISEDPLVGSIFYTIFFKLY